MINFSEISNSVIEGNSDKVRGLVKAALDAGTAALDILNKGLIVGLDKVGEEFSQGKSFLPELLISAKAMKEGLSFLSLIISKGNRSYSGKYLIGSVKGDIHDIGKNIVIMMLEAHGWEVKDLGVDVSPEKFCSEVEKGDFQILGMSALLTLTMSSTAKTIEALKSSGLRDKVKIMVGGAPVTQAFADKIGADAFAPDASAAVKVAETLIGYHRKI